MAIGNAQEESGKAQNLATLASVAEDLGVGLPTLTRWLSRNRDAVMNEPARREANEDTGSELKRLRRENKILRQEREVLKRATAFFPREGSR